MKRLYAAALGLLIACVVPGLAQAQTFACNDDLYQVRAGSGPSNTALLRFPQGILGSGGTATNIWGVLKAPGINAIGLNSVDNFIYGIDTATQVPQLYRLRNDGATALALVGTITTTGAQTPALTSSFVPTGGTFDGLGRYYFAGQGGAGITPSAIYRVDSFADIDGATAGVQIGVAAIYPLSTALANIGDFAFGPDGNLYGATATTLAQIRLPAIPGTATVTTATVANVGGIGSAFFSNPGDLYVYDNGTGELRRLVFNYGTSFPGTVIVGSPVIIAGAAPVPASTAASDGASCLLAPTTDVSVAITLPAAIAPGSTSTGTLTCTNNGPSAAGNVTCTASSTTPNVTVTVGTCTPPAPAAALRASAGANTITCPITIVTLEAAGGTNTTPTQVVVNGATSTTTTETITTNNTTSATTPIIDAINDAAAAPVNGATGGVAVANVLINDALGTVTATTSNVTLTQVSTTNPGVTLNPATGAVNVAPGTVAGTYTVTYRICSPAVPTACDTAQVSVTVSPSLTMRKSWVGAAINDDATVTATRGATAIVTLNSNADTANETDAAVAVVVTAGETLALAETLAGTNIGLYTSALACTGTTDANPADGVTVGATDSAIVCTFTNTRRPTVTVTKVSNGGVGTFAFTGTNGFANQSITTVTAGSGVAAATQVLTTASTSTTLTESAPPAGFALTAISCSGLGAGGTAAPTFVSGGTGGGNVVLDAAATAAGANIACTFTNRRLSADLAITKTNGTTTVTSGASTTYTVVVTNNGPDPVTGAVVTDTPNAAGLTCPPANPVTCAPAGNCPAGPLTIASLTAGVTMPTLANGAVATFTFTCAVQ